jgi:hypothetical protein
MECKCSLSRYPLSFADARALLLLSRKVNSIYIKEKWVYAICFLLNILLEFTRRYVSRLPVEFPASSVPGTLLVLYAHYNSKTSYTIMDAKTKNKLVI